MIYFDHNATTALSEKVRAAMGPAFTSWFGNPSSLHAPGRVARVALDECRHRIANLLGAKPSEFVFTSGGTESNNLAILGVAKLLAKRGRHLITSSIEHPSVLHTFQYLQREEGFELTILPVDRRGVVEPNRVREALRPSTILVSIMAANNETGTLQPVPEIGTICQERGVLFHTDAVQWFGKQPLSSVHDFQADLVSLCAHKFMGPKGSGLLFMRSPLRLPSLLHGGAQEDERRPGTENLAAILGLTQALELALDPPLFQESALLPLRARLESLPSRLAGVELVAGEPPRLANTASFTIKDCDNTALIAALDLEGICVSGGSACSTGALVPSHVLLAMGYSVAEARTFIRFSLGPSNTAEEVETALQVLPEVVKRVRAANNS